MRTRMLVAYLVVAAAVLLAACVAPTPATEATEAEEPVARAKGPAGNGSSGADGLVRS